MAIDSRPTGQHLSDFDLGLPLGRRYLIGVSGGCDSVALLHLFHQQGYKNLVVCHLNHGLRGRDSANDARFVRALAERLGFPFEMDKVEVVRLATSSGESIELSARRARHAFFAELASKYRCNRVVLAHHADDQAETVLMNVLRGTGLRGLAGMATESEMKIGRKMLQLLRPLLAVRRVELEAFATAHGISFREDASNRGREYLRNRVRLDLIPQASEVMGRDVWGALSRLSRNARADSQLLDQLVREGLDGCRHPRDPDGLATKGVGELPVALRSRVMLEWLSESGIGDLSEDLAMRVLALLDDVAAGGSPARCNLPGGHWVRRRAGRLFVERAS